MKTLLQAQPRLRGPQSLTSWLAQLPTAGPSGLAGPNSLPLEKLAQAAERAHGSMINGYPQSGRFGAQLILAVFALLFKKLSLSTVTTRPAPAPRPWLRRVLGIGLLLLLASAVRAVAG